MNAKLRATNSRTQHNIIGAIGISVITSNVSIHNEHLLVAVVVARAIPLIEHPLVQSVAVYRYGRFREIEGAA